MSKAAIDELKRIRSILSGITGLEDDDQEYIEDARKSVDRIIDALAEQPAPMIRGDIRDGLVDDEPAQRTWVGLTDEQWQSIADTLGCIITRGQKDAIEAKLKEKNT